MLRIVTCLLFSLYFFGTSFAITVTFKGYIAIPTSYSLFDDVKVVRSSEALTVSAQSAHNKVIHISSDHALEVRIKHAKAKNLVYVNNQLLEGGNHVKSFGNRYPRVNPGF